MSDFGRCFHPGKVLSVSVLTAIFRIIQRNDVVQKDGGLDVAAVQPPENVAMLEADVGKMKIACLQSTGFKEELPQR